jgi:hypothetical protein
LAKLPLFDRSGWTKVRFGDVVENVNETERDPGASGLERFIGLEHLEPGSLHVRTWGNVADGTTFTRRCRPGQVLFGKRRAYQRKVAVAEFDAVVSGDIYVLAPKATSASSRCSANDLRQDAGATLLPELLPFLCLSERFFQHAVGTSAGSLSPRTNWSSLASFELDLPPLDQQRRIAEILWAVDESEKKWIDATGATRASLNAIIEATQDDMFRGNCQALADLWPVGPDSGCSALPSTVSTGRAQNDLLPEHVKRIYGWYRDYQDVDGVARVVNPDEIAANNHNLNISPHVKPKGAQEVLTVKESMNRQPASVGVALDAEARFVDILARKELLTADRTTVVNRFQSKVALTGGPHTCTSSPFDWTT